MAEQSYNAQKHIDITYIKTIFENNAGKKIVCFGGGSAAHTLMEILPQKYTIEYFLDNNSKIQGTRLCNKEIVSPKILRNFKKDSFIVLILSKHVEAISSQLAAMGLEKNKDFYDIYSKFAKYFRIKKFEANALKFIHFIEQIPDNLFDNIPIKSNKKIGIVCICEIIKAVTWYPIAQCLLLRYNGYLPILILDNLQSFDDYLYFEGVQDVTKFYVEQVLTILEKKWTDMEMIWIDEHNCEDLDIEDMEMAKKYAPLVVRWFDSRRDDDIFIPDNPKRIEIAEKLLQQTMGNIKAFFKGNQYNVINVYTGIHRHRCVYTYLGKKNGLRVSTYDGDEDGTILYSSEGVVNWYEDVGKMLLNGYFTEEETKKLVELSKENFEKRKNSTVKDGGYNFQRVALDKSNGQSDIIIPLNIAWDSAALGLDDLFENDMEWMNETLEFIMKNTTATVMIREHPAQVIYSEFAYKNLKEILPALKCYPDRIRLVTANDEINTYQCIEQCKLVLPYTSTTGIEAILMHKPVILHTNVYYGKLGLGYKAKTKTDYFEKIKNTLDGIKPVDIDMAKAFLVYFYSLNQILITRFSECFTDWMEMSIEEVNQMDGVKYIIRTIAEEEPIGYALLKNRLKK